MNRRWPTLTSLRPIVPVVVGVAAVWALFFTWYLWGIYHGDPLRGLHVASVSTYPYDGQFVYYIAQELRPAQVAPRLDVPAYRYQRISLPLLSRLACGGKGACLPWAIYAWDALSHLIAVGLLAGWLQRRGHSPWWALTGYGLWPGLVAAFLAGLPEPLTYAWVIVALVAAERERPAAMALAYTLAVLAKEVALVFVVGHGLWALWQRRRDQALWLGLPVVVFLGWQGLLWHWFGRPGVGSGGAGATGWAWLPLAGLIEIGLYSPLLLAIDALLFAPVWVPAVLALPWSLASWKPSGLSLEAVLFLVNALPVLFLPLSTFREPAGLLRVGTGLQLAFVLFALTHRHRAALRRLTPIALALNVFWLLG